MPVYLLSVSMASTQEKAQKWCSAYLINNISCVISVAISLSLAFAFSVQCRHLLVVFHLQAPSNAGPHHAVTICHVFRGASASSDSAVLLCSRVAVYEPDGHIPCARIVAHNRVGVLVFWRTMSDSNRAPRGEEEEKKKKKKEEKEKEEKEEMERKKKEKKAEKRRSEERKKEKKERMKREEENNISLQHRWVCCQLNCCIPHNLHIHLMGTYTCIRI